MSPSSRISLLAALGLAFAQAFALGGCASDEVERHVEVPPREPRLIAPNIATSTNTSEYGDLTRKLRERIGEQDMVTLALGKSPELGILRQERNAARARLFQSGLYTYNPALFAGIDDLPVIDHHPRTGRGPYPGKEQLGIIQTIEFPTKRSRRLELGEALVRATDADFDAKEREVRTLARSAFAEVLAARDRLEVARLNQEVAERFHRAASARVEAKAAPPIDEAKAEVDDLRAQNEVRSAERDVTAAKARLVAILGDPALSMGEVEGTLAINGPELDLAALQALMDKHPSLVSKLYAVQAAEANLELQRSAVYPDPTFVFTYNRNRGDLDSLTANVLIPIPIINRNEGAIREAHLSIEKAEHDANATRAALVSQLQQAYSTYDVSRRNAQLIHDKALPAAERALGLAEAGWKAGKFRYLDVLDARRSFASTRSDYVTNLLDLNRSIAQLEGLTGRRLDEAPR